MNCSDPPTRRGSAQHHQLGAGGVDRPTFERAFGDAGRCNPAGIPRYGHLQQGLFALHRASKLDVLRQMMGTILGACFSVAAFQDDRVAIEKAKRTRTVTGSKRVTKPRYDRDNPGRV